MYADSTNRIAGSLLCIFQELFSTAHSGPMEWKQGGHPEDDAAFRAEEKQLNAAWPETSGDCNALNWEVGCGGLGRNEERRGS